MDRGLRQVKLACVEPHQYPDFVARIVPDLVNLVSQNEGFTPLLHPGKTRIFHDDGSVERSPRMLVEITADHIAIFRPLGKGDGGAVNANETFSVVVDEGQQISLLLRVHLKFAAS